MGANVSIAAIVVTYGARQHLLLSLLRRLANLSPRPDALVLVFNDVPYDPSALLAACPGLPPALLQRNEVNLGSAGGFGQGIAIAHARTTASHFWLLDDDLDPEPDALAALTRTLAGLDRDPDACLVSLRTQRWEYVQAARGQRTLRVPVDSFLGFTVFRRRGIAGPISPRAGTALREIGYAPWGGLLLHRTWHERIAPPRSDYFLYGDDHEYTMRIVRSGGRLLLCPASRLNEQEASWDRAPPPGRHFLLDDASSALRAFLTVRNRVAMEKALAVRSPWRYGINAAAFAMAALARSPAMWRRPRSLARRARLLARAVRDGWRGRLGAPTESSAAFPSSDLARRAHSSPPER